MTKISLATPLETIPGLQKRFFPKLKRLGLTNVRDLLRHFPTRYEDWSEISRIGDLRAGDERTIRGLIQSSNQTRAWKKKIAVTEVLIGDETGSIRAVWFNQPYIGKMLQEGKEISVAGKVSERKNELIFSNPRFELITKKGPTKHTGRIVPIYPETKGLTSKGIRFIIQPILEEIPQLEEFIPEKILHELDLPEINDALRSVHFPEKLGEALRAKRRFAFQDLFLLQLRNVYEKKSLSEQDAPAMDWDDETYREYVGYLPFKLTESQKKSLDEILRDITKPRPMNRLLQGDVGSGKTAVAGITALVTAKNGFQSAFMAPTEILARQHYKTFQKLFGEFDSSIGLLLSKEARVFHGEGLEDKVSKSKLQKDTSAGEISIIVGTHALIQKGVEFRELGLVVIDEQHRFGVKQRAELSHGMKLVPHFLSMSATPIPRTLMMTVFGNLDVSLITELPKGRKKIITKVVDPENRNKAYAFIRGEVRKGRQVYVICPRIEKVGDEGNIGSVGNVGGDRTVGNVGFVRSVGSEQIRQAKRSDKRSDLTVRTNNAWDEAKAVKEEYEKLDKKVFPDLKIGVLHGKLKSAEKGEVMKKFANGEIDVLVSTTVVEVGVDVPNATIMMIEGAERFGLAQLYQLRGRVGRSERQSFCFLFTDSKSLSTAQRLEALLKARNSFELAEMDLQIRGPGEFLGSMQSGMPDSAMLAIQNPELLKSAKVIAEKIFAEDPDLKKHPKIKKRLEQFSADIHLE